MAENLKFDTLALHGGYDPMEHLGAMSVPIYQTTAYAFESTDHAKELFELKQAGNIYTRLQNPTTDILEKRVALLEGGGLAVAFASGHSAMFLTFSCLASAGDEIISSNSIYGGAMNMMGISMNRLGIKCNFVDSADPSAFEAAITDKTRLIFVEALGNPNANIVDIEAISKIAKKYGIVFIVDCTLTTPYLLQPVNYGADVVIHSATKYLGGQGNSMAGVAIDTCTFDFKDNPRYPDFNNPDPSYHGIVFADLGKGALAMRLRALTIRDLGACISPFNSFLILQGIDTLSLRMQRHSQNALATAKFLEQLPCVKRVNYSGLESSPYYKLAQKYLPLGQSGMLTFELGGDRLHAAKFIDSLKLIRNVANLGDARTIISHPATTTHSQLTAEQLKAADISEGTIRLSIGLEDIGDITSDILKAAKAIG